MIVTDISHDLSHAVIFPADPLLKIYSSLRLRFACFEQSDPAGNQAFYV